MASTTEELTGQSDQLVGALGFFRTGDAGQAPVARSAGARPASSLTKLQEAVGHGVAPAASKRAAKSGVALKMRETGDRIDKEFERAHKLIGLAGQLLRGGGHLFRRRGI